MSILAFLFFCTSHSRNHLTQSPSATMTVGGKGFRAGGLGGRAVAAVPAAPRVWSPNGSYRGLAAAGVSSAPFKRLSVGVELAGTPSDLAPASGVSHEA